MSRQSWEDYKDAAKRGPMAIAVKIIFVAFTIAIFILAIFYSIKWFVFYSTP